MPAGSEGQVRNIAAALLIIAGVAGFAATCTLIQAPLPPTPEIPQGDVVSSRQFPETPEVADARAKLYTAQVKWYAEAVEHDALRQHLRPEWHKYWIVYWVVSVGVVILGLWCGGRT